MARVFNFSPGPGMLPETVMKKAQAEFLNYQNTGMSIMEMSHHSLAFKAIMEQTASLLKELLDIPTDYTLLFMPGGAHLQYAAIPMNLLRGQSKAIYIDTGHWSKAAIKEAKKYSSIDIIDSADSNTWKLDKKAAYLHYVDNETISGFEFPKTPHAQKLDLVCDMSSNILSRPIRVSDYALIYACAQKNVGPAGITLIIIRNDLLGHEMAQTPSMLSYQTFANSQSLYNTPATYPWYMTHLVCQWIKEQGGLEQMNLRAQRRSSRLYQCIDQSRFYRNDILKPYRSRINVSFHLLDDQYNSDFLAQASQQGLMNLKGHLSLGGMRASMYNAMPESAMDRLIPFMQSFEQSIL